MDTNDGENSLLGEEERSVLANEDEESHFQTYKNGPRRTNDDSIDHSKQGRRFRDQTEENSETNNFWTLTFQVQMRTACQ